MAVTVEIFSQGEELICGQTLDTNAAWLSEALVAMGFTVTRHTTVGDDLNALITLLQEIAQRADCCLCTGGLGPTSDDLTAEAVAAAFNRPLSLDPEALAQIQAFFERRQRPMPATNRKQALLPAGATRIDNNWGTAPGFALQQGRCWFAFVPGVPSEMRQLFQAFIQPYLQSHYAVQPSQRVTLKTIGIGESALQALINPIELPPAVQLGFRTLPDENHTKLLFPGEFDPQAKADLVAQFAAAIGDCVYGIDGLDQPAGDLLAVINQLLASSGKTISVIETLSQGLIAARCVGQPWLQQSYYQQSIERLAMQYGLAVPIYCMATAALAIAKCHHQQQVTDYTLVQLYSTESGGEAGSDQPVQLYTVLLSKHVIETQQDTVGSNLKRQQNQAAVLALDLLRRHLQHKTSNRHDRYT